MAGGIGALSGQGPGGSWETVTASPHPGLRPGVISYRGIRLALDRPRRAPGDTHRRGHAAARLRASRTHLTRRPAVGEHGGRFFGIEVLLAPWAAFTLFGTPQHELANRSVDPDELPHPLGRTGHGTGQNSVRRTGVGELASVLAVLPTWPERFDLLDDALSRWPRAGSPASPRRSAGAYGTWRTGSGSRSACGRRRRPGCCGCSGRGGCRRRAAARRRRRRSAASTTRRTSAASSRRWRAARPGSSPRPGNCPRCSCRRRTGSGARRRAWCWRPHVAGVRAVRFFQDRRAPVRAG